MKAGKAKRIIAAALTAILAATGSISSAITSNANNCGGLIEEDLWEPGKDEVIQDPILHWAIRSSLNAIKTEPRIKLTSNIVGTVKEISYSLCAHPDDFEGWSKPYWIDSLEGLQHASSMTSLEISYTQKVQSEGGGTEKLDNLKPISDLTQLTRLIMMQDGLSDISSLEKLTNMRELNLSGNHEISDISVVGNMKKLEMLTLDTNDITDVSMLADLEKLENLNISDNKISALPDLSKLNNLEYLYASSNNLTDEDVKKIGGKKDLKELDLKDNPGITDLKPLAGLIFLNKDKTFFNEELEGEKENLFAAIGVNKLLNKFSINHMQPSDLENVEKALKVYDELSAKQKAYLDEGRIEAARSNKELVSNGEPPKFYDEYEGDDEIRPVLDRMEITVVDKNGKHMPGVKFERQARVTIGEFVTDEDGVMEIMHRPDSDHYTQIITLADEELINQGYVAIPEKFEYETRDLKTYTVNNKRVTGLEQHRIMLVLEKEYVDKTQLKEVLESAKAVGEDYKYTAATYNAYLDALKAAQSAYDNTEASKEMVDVVAANLKKAISSLKIADELTKLKLIVKDQNGNAFTRAFKFQIYEAGTKKNAWNGFSDAETGVAYLEPGYIGTGEWTVDACYEEPYKIDTFNVTVAVKSDGKRYYKAVDKRDVKADFEKEIIVKALPGGTSDKDTERKPDSTVLRKRIKEALAYKQGNYTDKSFRNLQTAIQEAEEAAAKAGATQEDYNAAAAKLKKAIDELGEPANTVMLELALERYADYGKDYYTPDTWAKYQAEYEYARRVYRDNEATQKQVDEALSRLNAAEKALKMNRTVLQEILETAKLLKEEDYVSGYEELQEAIAEAQAICDDINHAEETKVKAALKRLQDAIDALQKPTPEKPGQSDKPGQSKPQTPAVETIKVTKINITGLSNKIAQGKKVTLKAIVSPSNAENKKVTWKSSNTKVATVNSNGVVSLKKKTGGKKVIITATAADGSNVKGSYKITSMKNPVKKISILGKKSVKAGKSIKLKAKVKASKGANKKVSWTSSNTKYAKVSASGKVKTYKAGKGKKVEITAKATDGSGKRKTVTIKIK